MDWTALVSLVNLVGGRIIKYIDDPKRKLEALQDFRDEAMKLAKEVTDAPADKVDVLELMFIDFIHKL